MVNLLTRIIHHTRYVSLGSRCHSAFDSLTNARSMPAGGRLDPHANSAPFLAENSVCRTLATDALKRRAQSIRLVLTDVDGVLTDGSVFYGEKGEAYKQFSLRDGMGVERLREFGIETGFITREDSPIVKQRADKLRLHHCYMGIQDKGAFLAKILQNTGMSLERLAYIGDDINDEEIIDAISAQGLVAAPCDALPEISQRVHYRCSLSGGHGAFREFAEWVLEHRTACKRNDFAV